jgi:hypothetical protein
MTVLRGRRLGSLLALWAAVTLLAAAMYWLQTGMPAFMDMLRPLYAVLSVILIVATWRWFRHRNKNYDRRHDDRRHPNRHNLDLNHDQSDGSDH